MILLVDDELFALEFLKRKLISENVGILTAVSIQSAMDLMEQHKEIQVVVTDLHFADGNGYELLEWTMKNRPDIKRVILSAHTYEEWRGNENKMALSEHILSKPVDVEGQLMPLLMMLLEQN